VDRTTCKYGHPWIPENLVSDGQGHMRCKICRNEQQRTRRAANPARYRSYDLTKRFGITMDDQARMFKSQGSCCKVCGSTEPNDPYGQWHIDHDHNTGEVRAVLCGKCNRTLGSARDDSSRLRALADYLEGRLTIG
jgi:hypothetical protein